MALFALLGFYLLRPGRKYPPADDGSCPRPRVSIRGLYVVPRGVHHQLVSVDGAHVILIEPSTTVNTGDIPSHLTAERRLD